MGASVRIFDLLERKPRMNVEGGDAEAAREFVPAVRFENVCFTYPSRPDEQVLHNVSSLQMVAVQTSSGRFARFD